VSCWSKEQGQGKRIRKRKLHLVNAASAPRLPKPAGEVVSKLYDEDDDGRLEDSIKELYRKSQHIEAQRAQQLTIAFLSGSVSLVILLVVLRQAHGMPNYRLVGRSPRSAARGGSVDGELESGRTIIVGGETTI
jgi:hypothetical protein